MNTILDSPPPREEKPVSKIGSRIAVAVEVMLWAIALVALLFKLESWEGSSQLFLLSFTSLAFFYLFLTFLVTGAHGREQTLGALGAGLSLALRLLGTLFVLESWAGGRVMLFLAIVLGSIAGIVTIYFLIKARQSEKPTGFHWKVLVRLAVVFLI